MKVPDTTTTRERAILHWLWWPFPHVKDLLRRGVEASDHFLSFVLYCPNRICMEARGTVVSPNSACFNPKPANEISIAPAAPATAVRRIQVAYGPSGSAGSSGSGVARL